jgi:hypothetical protein
LACCPGRGEASVHYDLGFERVLWPSLAPESREPGSFLGFFRADFHEHNIARFGLNEKQVTQQQNLAVAVTTFLSLPVPLLKVDRGQDPLVEAIHVVAPADEACKGPAAGRDADLGLTGGLPAW